MQWGSVCQLQWMKRSDSSPIIWFRQNKIKRRKIHKERWFKSWKNNKRKAFLPFLGLRLSRVRQEPGSICCKACLRPGHLQNQKSKSNKDGGKIKPMLWPVERSASKYLTCNSFSHLNSCFRIYFKIAAVRRKKPKCKGVPHWWATSFYLEHHRFLFTKVQNIKRIR